MLKIILTVKAYFYHLFLKEFSESYFSLSFRVKIVRLYSRLTRSTILSRYNILRHLTASTGSNYHRLGSN